ncbi:MAG: hypothetical protein GC145_11575 [Caulobacter sp.]|nr:hypothetical protein [Caulobacter sp.]
MIAVVCLAASGVAAQETSCDPGDKKVKAVRLVTGNMVNDMLVQAMLPSAIEDDALASDRVTAQPRTCARGAFSINGVDYQAFGQRGDRTPRWAAADSGEGAIAYLVPLDPEKPKGTLLMVVQSGDSATIVRAYNKPPADDVLRQEFAAALLGRFPPIVGYDRATRGSTIYVSVK